MDFQNIMELLQPLMKWKIKTFLNNSLFDYFYNKICFNDLIDFSFNFQNIMYIQNIMELFQSFIKWKIIQKMNKKKCFNSLNINLIL